MNAETGVVTTKGQVVIPARLRRRLGIKKGTKVCFTEKNGEIALRPVTDEYIEGNAGILRSNGKLLRALKAEQRGELTN